MSRIAKILEGLHRRKPLGTGSLTRLVVLGVAVTVVAGIAIGCQSQPAAPAQAPASAPAATSAAAPAASKSAAPIKIGALIPFTGVETHNGLSMRYGAEIAAEEINAAGGVLDRKIELVFEDTTGVPDVAVQKAKKLVQESKVDLIIGTLASNERNAVYDYTTSAKVLLLNPTFYEGVGLMNKYFFSTGAVPNQTIDPLAPYAIKNLGKTVYFVGSDYVWGTGSIAASKVAVEKAGGKTVGEEYAPFGTTDFSAIIRRIDAAKPDIVWPYVAGLDGVTFLKQLNDFGVKKKVKVVADYLDELVIPALSPEAAEGIVNTSTYYMVVDNPKNKEFLDKLKKKDPKALMGNFGMGMYYNVHLYNEAAKKVKATDTEKIIEGLRGASFDGPAGKVSFVPETQHAIEDVFMAQVQSDKSFKIIDTTKQVAPVLPDKVK